ncbi:MAG TPA: serine hydrolase [Ktedonobacteraceae bacterium]
MTEDPVPLSLTADSLHRLEENMRKVLDSWKVPGLALLLLRDGEVALARGFGKRNLAENLDVTSRTRLPIGSTSKAFTAVAIAMLVEESKLAWDTPIRQYIPTFKMYDSFATERLTVRDLLTHRCGLPRHELLWHKSRLTRNEAVERLQYLEPSKDLRTTFQYQNLMYATAGYLIECVTGQTWEAFVAERIFKPLGMTRSNAAIEATLKTDDYALPYEKDDDEVKEVPFYDRFQIIGPAGGISSNLEDLQHWLRFQLNGGKHGEIQLLAAAYLAENHTPQTIMPAVPHLNRGAFSSSSYGMGWVISTFHGQRMLQHSGGIDGFSAEIALLPDANAAVAVLSNPGRTAALYVAAFYACDCLLEAEPTDWSELWLALEAKEEMLAVRPEMERVPNAPHTHPLEAYTGEYEHPGYGVATIACIDDTLHFTYNDVTAPLTHLHYDIFEVFIKLAQYKTPVALTGGEKGKIESLAVTLEQAVRPIVFTRTEHKEQLEGREER